MEGQRGASFIAWTYLTISNASIGEYFRAKVDLAPAQRKMPRSLHILSDSKMASNMDVYE